MHFEPIARAPKVAVMVLALFAFAIALAGDAPFKGRAAGTATVVGLDGDNVLLHTAASGNSTHLGSFTSAEDLTLDPGTGQLWGTVTFTSANGGTMYGTTAAQFVGPGAVAGTYTITGGTGRLSGAAGSADFALTTPDGSNYTVVFAGSLSSH